MHTPDELAVAIGCVAPIVLVNQRDRATGKVIAGQAAAMAPLLPQDATCLACGGISRLDQVRTLRRAGYDGIVLGRALLGDRNNANALMAAITDEKPTSRVIELISVPRITEPEEQNSDFE